jgi:hypothetical protein
MKDEPIAGFNEYQESLFTKIMEPLNDYTLCKLKLQQLRQKGVRHPNAEALDQALMAAKDRISEILIQEKDM